ncbi:LysM domain-containing protein [Paenibacillus taihuensis]|uniref:LysM domain-containing protein n=2 Tax=Paenibacillus taihuensis TaxID=1156355 RepID=A0A3D9SDC5_9BACL|nr:LysM domain-containing protein [Paenibacillus taihuensis]
MLNPNSTNSKYGPRSKRAKKNRSTASILQVSTGLLLMCVVLYSIYATQSHFGGKPLASSPGVQTATADVTKSNDPGQKPANSSSVTTTKQTDKPGVTKNDQSEGTAPTTTTADASASSVTVTNQALTTLKDARPVSTSSASSSSSEYPKKYVVQKGDTLSKIALKFYQSKQQVNLIAEANDIVFINDMVEGDTITIPAPSKNASSSTGKQRSLDYSKVTLPAMYLVQSGDTLYHIAKQFYRTDDYVGLIAKQNDLDVDAGLKAGTSLMIPALPKHTVQAGETLTSIARIYYGSSKYVGALASYNQLDNNDIVKIGDELTMPQFDRDVD